MNACHSASDRTMEMTRSRSLLMGYRIRTGHVLRKYNDLIEPICFDDGSAGDAIPPPPRRQPELVTDGAEGQQQLVHDARHPVGPRVDPTGLAHQLVAVDPGAEQLPDLHLAGHRLVGDDADAEAG